MSEKETKSKQKQKKKKNSPSFSRRDKLVQIESQVQKWWSEGGDVLFQAEAKLGKPEPGDKFFGTFTMPHMNGLLHLGHAFTLSKLEFAAAYHRLKGANVLLPFAFHSTGMRIRASAWKLAREIDLFGYPPDTNKSRSQWNIMKSYGLPDDEIFHLSDPTRWSSYFARLAREDLEAFGLGCDWRRTFIASENNPYFTSFVGWTLRKLKAMGKILKASGYAVYSPLEAQPCADHERASGEGVLPQEYTLIKMEVLPPLPPKMTVLEGRKVYLAAATTSPETIYGATNCWVSPDGIYGAFEINDSDVFILTSQAARNLSYQKLSRVPESPTCLVELTGWDLIGLSLRSPLAFYKEIHALPMLSLPTHKGTGIAPSVPSESPHDYMALHDLKAKPAFRAQFGVMGDWVVPFETLPIISHPDFGDRAAARICIIKCIESQTDKVKLDEAARLLCKGGLCQGKMLVAEFNGMDVREARGLIRSKLVNLGQAVVYYEPEREVVSRFGDKCVVALTDQWFISYGEHEWKTAAAECLAGMNLYSEGARRSFEHTLSRLNQWACSRNLGLGTRIPWDEELFVESLSDSTLYTVYYTVAHLLQGGDMYGTNNSSVKPELLTDDVWDYLFDDGPYPIHSGISDSLLRQLKQEFEYWYPFDLRVSGKDLIRNHLTFCLYSHVALMPKHNWPRGFRCNGHIMLNSKKMSSSTGNFTTLRQAVREFSADATRFALADAGDGMGEARFVYETANTAILRLTREIAWMEHVLADKSSLESGPPITFADRVFANEINIAIKMTEKNYKEYMFRAALTSGFYNLQAARDSYRRNCGPNRMNTCLVKRFMDVQTRLIAPICPHYAEYVWRTILKEDGYVVKSGWPKANSPDLILERANKYLHDTIFYMKNRLHVLMCDSKKHKNCPSNVGIIPSKGYLFVIETYDLIIWECLMTLLQKKFDAATCTFAPDEKFISALSKFNVYRKNCAGDPVEGFMPFLKSRMHDFKAIGTRALEPNMPYGEFDILSENLELIKLQLGLKHLEVLPFMECEHLGRAGHDISHLFYNRPLPGKPAAIFIKE